MSPRTALKGPTKETFEGHGVGWKPVYAKPSDIFPNIPEVWLLSPDNLFKSLYEWRTGPLHRLSKMLTERFLETDWVLDYHGNQQEMPAAIRKMREFFKSAVTEFPFWKDDLKPKLETAIGDYIGKQARVDLQPDLQTIEDWLKQQLQASFAADVGGPLTPLERMGHGWQSLMRLAALDVISQYPEQVRDKVVLLFEEPETFLHPHLRRKLRNVLDRLASQGWYIVCATHAPEFISFTSSQSVVRLWREGNDVEMGSIATSNLSAETKFQEKLDEYGNHEMLFCNRLILCEGKDDVFAAQAYLQKTGVDLNSRSISILGVGGIASLPEYARMASELRIPWCAITDEDLEAGGSVKEKTKDVRDQLVKLRKVNDILVEWPGDLESMFGVTGGSKATPKWQRHNVEHKSLSDLKVQCPGYVTSGEKLRAWVEGALPPTSAKP